MKRLSVLAASVIAMGLYTMPARALTGNVQDLMLDKVMCLNTTTGASTVGTFSGNGEFDCGGLPVGADEEMSIVLLGTSNTGPAGCGNPVAEQEPNNPPQPQDVGTLSPDCSISVTGNISIGYDDFSKQNPNADWDIYGFALQGVIELHVEVDIPSQGEYAVGVRDAVTMQYLQCQFTSDFTDYICAIPAQTTRVLVGVSAQKPTDYMLTISGTGLLDLPSGLSAQSMQGSRAPQLHNAR